MLNLLPLLIASPWAAEWPEPGSTLSPSSPSFPEGFGVHKVYLDAGHGASGNPGNTSAFCVSEQDEMLRIAQDLKQRLEATGHFEVKLSRQPGQLTEYKARVAEAKAWGAEVFLSLHSDARGQASTWAPEPGKACETVDGEHGVSVLYSDEGGPELASQREDLALALGESLTGAGFPPYRGQWYGELYAEHTKEPGVFLDTHAPSQRIMVLRRPEMASVIIETHQAWDPDEPLRWQEEATLRAFGDAVATGLVAYLESDPVDAVSGAPGIDP
jgi:N-acetylmuramoyl-L-alanine amidase